MKFFYAILFSIFFLTASQCCLSQCTGVKGPNLLGAKGTFSVPFVVVNTYADNCTSSGANSFSPNLNIGMPLLGCQTSSSSSMPCSDYTYTAKNNGLQKEYSYSIVKTVGNSTGGNCLKTDWRGADHTGDGGFFMAVNGAPNTTFSSVFYQIKSIPVCIGTVYEFSAWVINLLPANSKFAQPGTQPNISFKVNGASIATSGPIAYTNSPVWVKVSGSFTASTDKVDLQVVNATSVAMGNDLGLDDISINVCQSHVAVNGPVSSINGVSSVCDAGNSSISYVVTDATHSNNWYNVQKSVDGGTSFTTMVAATQASYTGNSFTYPLQLGVVNTKMNGNKYRINVATTQAGLANPDCVYFNDYTLIVNACEPLPVRLSSFTGSFLNGIAALNWQTSQELNNDHFELFKSYDGVDFTSVARIGGAGFSNTVKNYSYKDHAGGSNNVFYRLKQVDINGKETFSDIIKLSLGAQSGIEVFPNPFKNGFTVTVNSSKTTLATLVLHNASGQIVYTKIINLNKGNNAVAVTNLSAALPSGLLYVTLQNDEINFNCKMQKL